MLVCTQSQYRKVIRYKLRHSVLDTESMGIGFRCSQTSIFTYNNYDSLRLVKITVSKSC